MLSACGADEAFLRVYSGFGELQQGGRIPPPGPALPRSGPCTPSTEAEECLEALAPSTERAGVAPNAGAREAPRLVGQVRTRLGLRRCTPDPARRAAQPPARPAAGLCGGLGGRDGPLLFRSDISLMPVSFFLFSAHEGVFGIFADGFCWRLRIKHVTGFHVRRDRGACLLQRGPDDSGSPSAVRTRCRQPGRVPARRRDLSATATTGAPRSRCSTSSARISPVTRSPRSPWSRRPMRRPRRPPGTAVSWEDLRADTRTI